MTKQNSVAKNTVAMGAATLCSRATGLLRTWTMAFALGNTVITSAYQVANNMPNVIYDFIAGGLIGAAFIPIFMLEKQRHGAKGGSKFSSNMLNITIIILGVISLLATIFAPAVIATQTFTVADTARVTELSILFFRIFAFQILFYGVGGILQGIANAERIYFLPALAPAINNLVVIASFLACAFITPTNEELALYVLGVGTTLGVLVQTLMLIPSLRKCKFKWRPVLNFKDPALIDALKIAIPTFIYIIGTLVAFSCRNAFSLQITDSGPSTLLYAWTWFQLPYGVIAVSVSRTMFTEMSEASAKSDNPALRTLVNNGLTMTVILIIPMAVLMFVFATPLMSLFRAGSFNSDDVTLVATVLKLWVISLPIYSMQMYLYNTFAAIRKFGTFALVSTICVLIQCALYWGLTQIETIGIAGVPFGDFAYYLLSSIILLIVLYKKIGNFRIPSILLSACKMLIASVVGGACGWLLMKVVNLGQTSMVNGILQLVICGGVALLIIFALSWVLNIGEVKAITRKLFKRGKRSK